MLEHLIGIIILVVFIIHMHFRIPERMSPVDRPDSLPFVIVRTSDTRLFISIRRQQP